MDLDRFDQLNDAAIDDVVIPFQIADTAVRGRIVRLGPVIDDILARHAYPDALSEVVGEAAALTAMLGASLKFDGKLTLQISTDGPVKLLVSDFTAAGTLRACATVRGVADAHDREGLARAVGDAGADELLGSGSLAMTLDQGADMERYQGVTPFAGGDLAAAALSYFSQSEQIPTAIKLAVGRNIAKGERPSWRAGGVIAQFVPSEGGTRERGEALRMSEEDDDVWRRAAMLLDTAGLDELLDPTLPPARLLYRLYHEDGVRVFDPKAVAFACTCGAEKIIDILARYSDDDLKDMEEDGVIKVTCEFCGEAYRTSQQGVRAFDKGARGG